MVPCDGSSKDPCVGDAGCCFGIIVFSLWDYALKGLRENGCPLNHCIKVRILLNSYYDILVINLKMNIESCVCLLLIDWLIEL